MRKHKSSKQIILPSPAERRQIENEVVFRRANEKVQKDLDKLDGMVKAEGHNTLIPDKDMLLHFYCECSDENCRERIVLTLRKYQELHRDRSQFIVMPTHETKSIEDIVAKKIKYSVVDKFVTPPDTATTLNSTSINNTS